MTVKTISEVLDAAKWTTTYIQNNDKTPPAVKVDNLQVSRATFNRMMAATTLEIANNSLQNILTDTVKDPSKPIGGLPDGEMQKAEYLKVAKAVKDFIAKNKQMPNYIVTSMGKMSPFNFMDMFSRALNYYHDTGNLPNFIYTSSLGVVSNTPKVIDYPSNIDPYLDVTKNCNWKDSSIINLAKQIIGNETSMYNRAHKIFEWVRINTSYEEPMYYNTRHGALGTLKVRMGNCCDLSHLLVALFRAANIPAGYKHVLARFNSFTTGHLVSCAYVDGKWYEADASNNKNRFSNTLSWELVKKYAFYRELPF